MAIKDQCLRCKQYNASADLCTIKWVQPTFDGSDCNDFIDHSSTKTVKADNTMIDKGSMNEDTRHHQPSVRKRGFSKSGVISIEGKGESNHDDENDEDSKHILYIPESIIRIIGIVFIIVLILSGIYGGYSYIKNQEKQEREELVWKARIELEEIRTEKTILYLRIYNMDYKENLLTLSCLRNLNQRDYVNEAPDSLIHKEIASLVSLNPKKWESICKYLEQAQVDLAITYSDVHLRPTLTIPYQFLSEKLLAKRILSEGLNIYVNKKEKEVLDYAQKHFYGDRYFSVDSLSMQRGYVALYLTYDDSKARLGDTFLDTIRVNPHYTDPVGDMGSILDGMLAISTRTGKGIAFVYVGKNSRKVDGCKWNEEETKEIAKKYSGSLHIEGRKTNQVKTGIIRNEK